MTQHNQHPEDPHDEDGLTIITFENEDGETIEFAQLIVFEVDGSAFAALTPAAQLGRGDLELFLFHTGEEDGSRFYTPVEEDDVAQRGFDIAVELLGGAKGEN